jgi:NAD(P)-dependent dehydrogenase (short-subunit alcohol dehydrogenase family)
MAPTNRFDISGRNYVVTGGAQGIGAKVVESLLESGANVVGLDIKSQPTIDYADLAARHNVKAGYFQADVTNEESLTKAFGQATGLLGSIDGSVTCAGIALEKAFEETSWNETRRLQEVNVRT